MAISQINTNSIAAGAVSAADLASGAITTAALPAGSVLQVVQSSITTNQSISSTSFVDTPLTRSITPTSASSKILVMFGASILNYRNLNQWAEAGWRITRNGSAIATYEYSTGGYAGTGSNGYHYHYAHTTFMFLDSPNSTSSVTYTLQGKLYTTSNDNRAAINDNNSLSTVTLMEIAG